MYSRAKILTRIAEVEAAEGVKLHYYTPEEAQSAKEHLTSKATFNDKGEFVKWTKPLDSLEKDFIRNEALLCPLDFLYAATRYAYIMSWEKRLQLFSPNIAQSIALSYYGDIEDLGLAIVIQALKARQLGMSTLAELIIWHRSVFCPYTSAIVGSSDPDKSALMFGMVERAWRGTPFYLRPQLTKFSTGEYYNFDGIESRVTISHGTAQSGMGRGTTPNVAHLSEVCDWDDPKAHVDAALGRAMHEIENMFLVLESTANGRGDWWHTNWQVNVENKAEGIAKMHPMFLPWFVGKDIYPTPTWLKARPIPASWEPSDITLAHAAKARDYVQSTPLLTKHLGTSWQMPREQMWFYEIEKKWATQKGELNIFLSEMPANPEEAFQSKAGSIFPAEVISERRDATSLPKWALSAVGEGIPERLVAGVKQRHPSLPPIIVGHRPPNGRTMQWRLEPLVINSTFNPMEKLCLWELPEEGEQYEIAVDTGYGIGQDRTVIQILRRGTPSRPDSQVGEWVSAHAGALDIWPILLAVGKLFTTYNSQTGEEISPRITIEMAANGEALQAELRKLGWRHFYIRTRLGTQIKPERIVEPVIGWTTTFASRPRLLDHLIKIVRDGLVQINSPWLIDELADLQRSEKNIKIEAGGGGFDDRVMSFAMGCYVTYDMDPRGEPSVAYRRREEEKARWASEPTYTPGKQAMPEAVEGVFEWL